MSAQLGKPSEFQPGSRSIGHLWKDGWMSLPTKEECESEKDWQWDEKQGCYVPSIDGEFLGEAATFPGNGHQHVVVWTQRGGSVGWVPSDNVGTGPGVGGVVVPFVVAYSIVPDAVPMNVETVVEWYATFEAEIPASIRSETEQLKDAAIVAANADQSLVASILAGNVVTLVEGAGAESTLVTLLRQSLVDYGIEFE